MPAQEPAECSGSPKVQLSQAGQPCGAADDTSVPGALAGIDSMVRVQIQPARRKMTGSAAHGQINDACSKGWFD